MENSNKLPDIRKIMEILPHRYPFLLVDRIIEYEKGVRIKGYKNVTFNEPFFMGHFPGAPVMPGVLIIEAMAQTGGVLALSSYDKSTENALIYFMGIDKARFRKPVTPGDQLVMECQILKIRSRVCRIKAEAYVDDELVAEAILLSSLAAEGG